jgi:L-iditol 2-dehydrogenase
VSTVARAGEVVLVGMGGDEVRLPLSYVQDRELVVTGASRFANTWPIAIRLVAAGRVDLDAMVTGHYGLVEVESVLTAARSDPTVVKAVVRLRE